MDGLRPNEQRAKAAISLIWIVMVINVIMLMPSVTEVFFLVQYMNGEEISQATIEITDILLAVGNWILTIVYIISIIMFIRWFRRAYYNLYTITGTTEYGDGWAAGAWFIPIGNLYIPYGIMKELYVKTDRYLFVEDNEDYSDNRLSTDYLGWWWALWIICGVGGNLAIKFVYDAESWDSILFSKMVYIGYLLLSIVLAFVTVIVIRDYAEAEKRLHAVAGETKNDRAESI